jgi:hypothetical protein
VQDVIDNSKSITYGGKTVELLPSEVDWKITNEAAVDAADLSSMTHIATTPGDTIFSFVSGLANSLGLVIYATPRGLITIDKLIRFDADTIFTLKNVPGAADNNILEGELAENIGGYHSYRRIMGQVNGSSYDAEHQWGIDVKSNKLVLERLDTTFQGLQKAKVAEITDTDLTAWTSNPGRFAKDCPEGNRMLQNLRIAENRELFKFTYKVPGHGQQYPNDPAHIANYDVMKQISVQDDLLGIDSKFLIFSVNFEGSRNEQSTTLEIGSAESSKPYKEMYEAIRGGGYILPVITMEPVRIRA